MPELSAQTIVFLACVGLFTLVTAVRDVRTHRIPNLMTVPMFLAGLAYQVAFRGWAGLGDAALGFLLGFGTLFVLWLIGGGGGGDAKLMGALSVWLGYRMTLWVLLVSTVLVMVLTFLVVAFSVAGRGVTGTKARYGAAGDAGPETVARRQQRRIMAYALPVALATWAVVLWRVVEG